ncbi:REP-associated tyrosine transposase [Stenotrophomonas maltophilia]|uniref:REP-associated tyrosine transposase n=1 Tax=Stenotrophomonas muris TaxID=2963283 RepID=UPI000F6F9B89|nr:Transposase and inactivated derivatives [Stenotrophomonas maltophilia]
MASPALRFGRWSQTDNVYAITAVTRARRPWFDDKANVDLLIEALRTVERTGRTSSLAWVVMPDHLHWLVELRTGTLAGCMQILKSRSGRSIARRVDANAPIWQAGFYDHALRSDECLRTQAMYIAANPVRAGLATRIGEYPYVWSRWRLWG